MLSVPGRTTETARGSRRAGTAAARRRRRGRGPPPRSPPGSRSRSRVTMNAALPEPSFELAGQADEPRASSSARTHDVVPPSAVANPSGIAIARPRSDGGTPPAAVRSEARADRDRDRDRRGGRSGGRRPDLHGERGGGLRLCGRGPASRRARRAARARSVAGRRVRGESAWSWDPVAHPANPLTDSQDEPRMGGRSCDHAGCGAPARRIHSAGAATSAAPPIASAATPSAVSARPPSSARPAPVRPASRSLKPSSLPRSDASCCRTAPRSRRRTRSSSRGPARTARSRRRRRP